MNREQSGINGQFVTTWGRELVAGVWTGSEYPITTTLTCVCGHAVSYKGFPHTAANLKTGFCAPLSTREWFCSAACAAKHRAFEFQQVITDLEAEAATKKESAERMRRLLSSLDV